MSKDPITKESLQRAIDQLSEEIHLTEVERRQVQNLKQERKKVVAELEQKNRELLSKQQQLGWKQDHLRRILKKENNAGEIYESRWGFHPCSRTHYQKLKYLRSKFYEALRKQAAWDRWSRKKTTNRRRMIKIRNSDRQVIGYERGEPIQEPPRCPIFSRTVRGTSNAFEHVQGVHMYREHPTTLRNTFVEDMGIEQDFLNAHPQKKIEDVTQVVIPEQQLDIWVQELMHLEFLSDRQKNR
jgi:hypothetical protein